MIQQELEDLAVLFKVLGDPTRISILSTLSDQERPVSEIAEILGKTPSAISHQLKTLKQAKLVKNRSEGKTRIYSLDDSHVHTIFDQGLEHIREHKN